jgi:hypothetical protein
MRKLCKIVLLHCLSESKNLECIFSKSWKFSVCHKDRAALNDVELGNNR